MSLITSEAKWRLDGPITSKLAALSISEESLTNVKRAILLLLEQPMTDEVLVETMHRLFGKAIASPSGIRSRRATLTELGLVEQVGYGSTESGRKAIIWQVTNV